MYATALALVLAAQVSPYLPQRDPNSPPGWTIAPLELSPQQIAQQAAPYGGDGPAAFIGILNVERARYGIPPVVLDQRFVGTPASPHYVATQIRNYTGSIDALLRDTGHRAALLRPDLVAVGVALRRDNNAGYDGLAAIGVVNQNGSLMVPDRPVASDNPYYARYRAAMLPFEIAMSPTGHSPYQAGPPAANPAPPSNRAPLYYATDRHGRVWQHTDANWVRQWAARQ